MRDASPGNEKTTRLRHIMPRRGPSGASPLHHGMSQSACCFLFSSLSALRLVYCCQYFLIGGVNVTYPNPGIRESHQGSNLGKNV